jgi:predicted adenine nucleotide alpha hydrolase (AANH) superfamily ATPase
MKILLHICCAPCAIYPLEVLARARHSVHGLWYNPNIHPYQEFARRMAALDTFATKTGLKVIWDKRYDLEEFFRAVVFREAERCRFCYHRRLLATALMARRGKFDAFTSTLLYSRFQNHELIRELGQMVVQEVGVPFYYEDFRKGWAQGAAKTKELGLYKQQYCGCIFSERDRYAQPSKESRG